MFMILLISCALLGPEQSPPRANPAPNADLATYQSMQAKASRDPAAHIRMALWCEQHGLNAEKLKHLALAVLKDPQNTLARGLMGLLPNGGRWETPEAVSARLRADELLMARLAEYNRRRDELQAFENSTMPVGTTVQNRWAIHHPAAEVAAAHAKLGVWCEQNGLKPEAIAHFTQAVELDPYRDSAWKHLGYVKHNGRWMNHEQIAAEEKEAIEQTRADRLWEPRPVSLAVNASPQYEPPRIYSCFVAGTPVRTINGHRPIESVRVGDRLLTQDVTTGALSFQLVMVVQHNAPAETIRVALDNGETITASTYHRFWQVGKGWAMAKQLRTGDTLRTLGGIARVVSLEPGATVPVFNLDVAGARTFFVGMKDALVHDNTLPDSHMEPFDAAKTRNLHDE